MDRKDIRHAEVLFDLTWNLAWDSARHASGELGGLDSREKFHLMLAWTAQFELDNATTDWDKVDYIEAVDSFYAAKVAEKQS